MIVDQDSLSEFPGRLILEPVPEHEGYELGGDHPHLSLQPRI
jgi:hypothetical protein